MRHHPLAVLFTAVLLVFGAAACGGEPQEDAPAPVTDDTAAVETPPDAAAADAADADTAAADTAATDTARVAVEDFEYTETEDGTRLFTGVLYNGTDAPIDRAQIQVSLLDADNRQVGTDLIVVNNVPAGARKEFSEPIESELDVRAARVRSVVLL